MPPEPKIEGIKDQAFVNIREQARLQVQGREERRHIYDLLVPPEPGKGLCSLPAPSPGDMFLDFEGDQFTFEGGLEYLFGMVTEATGEQGNRGKGKGEEFGVRNSDCGIRNCFR